MGILKYPLSCRVNGDDDADVDDGTVVVMVTMMMVVVVVEIMTRMGHFP